MQVMNPKRPIRGFTLVELAIVLAVAAILFAGLWRLMSSGGQQLRDQAAASQHQQLLSAVKNFLASGEGQAYMIDNGGVSAINITLSLPGVAPISGDTTACKAAVADSNLKVFCDYLPAGFSSATTNAYDQAYAIKLKIGPVGAAPNKKAPTSYSFMIMTSGGEDIPDVSGGRVASLIGGDGGFVYSSTDVCYTQLGVASAPLAACGAFGAWMAAPVADYDFASSAGGHVASRTFVSADQDSTSPWLARVVVSGDDSFSYNTMSTKLRMAAITGTANDILMNGSPNSIYMGDTATAINGGTLYMNAGSLYLLGGVLSGTATTIPSSTVASGQIMNINEIDVGPNVNTSNPVLVANGKVQINDDTTINGSLWAASFLYSSDERLKTDIKELEGSLEKLAKLKAVSFTLKDNGKHSMGVIAQDVEKVYPELVKEMDSGYKAVDYMGFVGPLIGAVKELKAENENLRHELEKQAAEIKKLRK